MDWVARLAERRGKISEGPPCQLTKPTKAPSVSFDSKQDGRFQQKFGDDDLLARCQEACRGLIVSPARLLATLNESDREAMLSGDPDELAALRTAAEVLAKREWERLHPAIERAYQHCRKDLAQHPEWHKAIWTVDPDGDPYLLAVAVRGVGCACLRIDKQNIEGREFELLELIDRAGTRATNG